MSMRTTAVAVGLLASLAGAASAVSLGPSGYSENFNSMGTTGTTPPADWTMWTFAGSNTTWAASIPVAAMSAGTQVTPPAALGVFTQNVTTPTLGSTNNNGLNLGFSTNTADRALGTSPTTVAGTAIQLFLTNNTGAALNSITVSYDIEIGSIWQNNELPGYRFFYTTAGVTGTWFAVASLDSVVTSANTVGSSVTVSATITFAGGPVADGSNIWLRWVDDNAAQTSPDQIYGIDNVSVIPTPGAAVLFLAAGVISARRRR